MFIKVNSPEDYLKHLKRKDKTSLKHYTTLRVGGPALALWEAVSAHEVVAAAQEATSMGIPWRVIGYGSNILAADEGVECGIIVFKDSTSPRVCDDGSVVVSGGYLLADLVHLFAQKGFGGIENLAGIPGTTGGAILGNAGAYGSAIGERIISARILDRNGRMRSVAASELAFAYRHSALKETGEAILEAKIAASPADSRAIEETVSKRLSDRSQKHPDPATIPTAGSWFKNLRLADGTMEPAGRLLEATGCKTLRVGGASVWPRHANIIVTDGTATAAEIRTLADTMASRVQLRFGIALAPEVFSLG
jgi:UDP-N-acetylmuramate dehydrogenase